MPKTKGEFFANIQAIEQACWFPRGRDIDGSTYSCHAEYWGWIGEAIEYYGGLDGIRALIDKRKEEGEVLAERNCANWWLWTILNEQGVSRVRD